jgi:hypothetical protein
MIFLFWMKIIFFQKAYEIIGVGQENQNRCVGYESHIEVYFGIKKVIRPLYACFAERICGEQEQEKVYNLVDDKKFLSKFFRILLNADF